MDLSLIGNLIGTVGFPITCVIVLFIQNNKFSELLSNLSTTLALMNERIEKIEDTILSKKGDS